ncbi:kinase-like domain-containing protein [Glomus cerebriforme]|uniref:Kinase-like domain-containing protein n=1 Tax=Glomus cerebriforme TaxID=658196 RepID=A0A397S778_9GLOM|nr:kinase-like domain-containing protein [Glomus cerebriforme]
MKCGMWGRCKECEQENTGAEWCNSCNAKHFQQNFKNWTSYNDYIDKFIQDTQLSAHSDKQALEWISFDRFRNIEYIARGGFSKVYRAIWIDGYIDKWDNENQTWKRYNSKLVAMKSLYISENFILKFINEIKLHHKVNDDTIIRLYGITYDPVTKNYMMILGYATHGSLRNFLDTSYNKYSWIYKFRDLWDIASGLEKIHNMELIHRDLHISNILHMGYYVSITDMGLCKPADYNESENTKKSIYGVVPYIAPEILRGQNYTKAADIYTMKICQGFRPMFNIKVPRLIVLLIKRCLDTNPLNRPTTEEIRVIMGQWCDELKNQTEAEIEKQIKEADEINNSLSNGKLRSTSLSYKTHSEAIYTSRLLDFKNLPEPKNSDDYYEQYDNIISQKYSESLQIDISNLKINRYQKKND